MHDSTIGCQKLESSRGGQAQWIRAGERSRSFEPRFDQAEIETAWGSMMGETGHSNQALCTKDGRLAGFSLATGRGVELSSGGPVNRSRCRPG